MFYDADEISVVEYPVVFYILTVVLVPVRIFTVHCYFIMTNQLIDQYYCVA